MDDQTTGASFAGGFSLTPAGASSPSAAIAAADADTPEPTEPAEPVYELPPSQFEIPNTVALDNELVRRLEHPDEFADES